MADEKTPEQQEEQAPKAQAPQRQALQVDDSQALGVYANFCRVTGTPEELVVDFGMNTTPMGIPTDPIKIKQRLIVNFYTAKRMLAALQMAVQRHEAAFGVLETDINRRITPQARQAAQAAAQAAADQTKQDG